MNDRYASETQGLHFEQIPIQFYPEDEEKMKDMDIKERIAFMRKLKEENRYIRPLEIVDEQR